MRPRLAAVALCWAGLATGACAGAPQAAADGDVPPDRATLVVCAAVLGTLDNAIRTRRIDGDPAPTTAGYQAYAARAAATMGETESRQAIASSFAFYDSLTSAQLERAADMCLAAADGDFSDEADWW